VGGRGGDARAGGEAIADIDTLRYQAELLGPVASPPTVWRTLDEATPAALKRVEQARAGTRRQVWVYCRRCRCRRSPVPTSAARSCWMSTTLVTRYYTRKREQAKATFKGGFGFHPLGVWWDNTIELLAVTLRPGNAGANHAGDHIDVLSRAIAQVPTAYRRRLLVRADGAGATHELLDWLTGQSQIRGLEYSVGFPTKNTALTSAITTVPKRAWTPAVAADGEPRDSADVAEVTGLLDLRRWPAGMRVIVRRERPHPGAQLSLLEEANGWRYQAFATNTATGQLAFMEARHRAPCPRRGPHQRRQGHRPGPVPLPRVQDQRDVAAARRDRRRPDRWLRLLALTGDQATAPRTANRTPQDQQRRRSDTVMKDRG
jgi:hypothetical protein